MKQLTVRNVDPTMAKALAAEARRRRKSLNQTVLEVLAQGLGLGPEGSYDNGLGSLAGTWSEEDLQEFDDATAQFEEVDEELWR